MMKLKNRGLSKVRGGLGLARIESRSKATSLHLSSEWKAAGLDGERLESPRLRNLARS